MEFRFVHFYPELMSLYGSYANLALLQRHLEELGNTVRVDAVQPGDAADLTGADFIYLGAGTERSALAALEDLRRFAPALAMAGESGVVQLYAGTAMELLGQTVTAADGTVSEGLKLAPFASVQGSRRIVGDVYGQSSLCTQAVVGYMNKCAVITGVETPLLTSCAMGYGNDRAGGPEGYHAGSVFASELTGPILVKNPELLRAVLLAILARRGVRAPEHLPEHPYETAGYAITARQLKARSEKN